jgi:adenylate cyclase
MKKEKIIPITRKLNIIFILTLFVGIGGVVSIFLYYLIRNMEDTTVDNLKTEADIIYNSIETMMIPGNADLAVDFFNKTNLINPDYKIKLYRESGVIAFSDDQTIKSVNERIGFQKFKLGTERIIDNEQPVMEFFTRSKLPNPDDIIHSFQWKDPDGMFFFRIYQPLQNVPKCFGCHGTDHSIRGVIDIRSNINDERKEQYTVLVASTGIFLALVLILTFILTRFLRVTLLRPVSKISNVCSDVTTGNFSSRVDIKNKDEIGLLGKTVNTMVEGLYERFELSKYVSASTIQSLRDEKKGKRVPLTIMFSDIRGFTSFTEGNEPEMVVQYLNKILNVQTEIIHQYKGDVDKYVGDEIVALYHDTEPEISACMTALAIQKEIEEKTAKLYGGLRVGIGINCGDVIL